MFIHVFSSSGTDRGDGEATDGIYTRLFQSAPPPGVSVSAVTSVLNAVCLTCLLSFLEITIIRKVFPPSVSLCHFNVV